MSCKPWYEHEMCGILVRDLKKEDIEDYLYNYKNSIFLTNDKKLLEGLKAVGYETLHKGMVCGIESFMKCL